MADTFDYDVFVSYSSQDKDAVRDVAERLKNDGLKVWFDEWIIKPGDSIPAKIEDGLENSRILLLCMSEHAFGSEWTQLESYTFRFRDQLNNERRFIPLRLDDTPAKGSLAQFAYIRWFPEEREKEYKKLLEVCRPPAEEAGQIYHNYTERSNGIDGKIEFRDDQGRATGKYIYIHFVLDGELEDLLTGGSSIARQWKHLESPVRLVTRMTGGEIVWIQAYLGSDVSKTIGKSTMPRSLIAVSRLTRGSERLDVMSIRRWREKILDNPS
jgi:hypothetical protein